jgi:hypothetical protein
MKNYQEKVLIVNGDDIAVTNYLEGFPKLIWSGIGRFDKDIKGERKHFSCRILVLELLGSSLSIFFDDFNHKFSLKTVLLLGIKMVRREIASKFLD